MKPSRLVMPFVAAFCLLASSAQGQGTTASPGTIAAKVNGQPIMLEQVVNLFRSLPRRQQELGFEALYRDLVEQLVSDHLLLAEARKEKLEENPEFKRLIAEARDNIMRDLIRHRIVEGEVDEKAVRERYEKVKDNFKPGAEVAARHILLRTEDEAKDVIKRLGDGEDFSVLARKVSIGPSRSRGGALGYFRRGEMVKPFADAAFDMDVGSYSREPINTDFGWHVIRVDDRREARLASFDTLAGQIRQALSREAISKQSRRLKEGTDIMRYSLDGQPLKPGDGAPAADKK